MKNVLLALSIIVALGLGCGYELTKKEPASGTPTEESSTSSEDEKRDLEKKIAELEKEKLEEKIDELEKEVEDQKRKPTPAQPKKKKTPTPRKKLEPGYMRVNSPGDGWLALRSGPNSGSRLLVRIPHGSVVQVDYCGSVVRSGKLRGRWCEVVYKGRKGWSFDYYLRR